MVDKLIVCRFGEIKHKKMETFKGTKGVAVIATRARAVNIGSLKVKLVYPSAGAACMTAMDMWAETEKHDKQLICEAFNVANETNQTPRQLKEELEKCKKEKTEATQLLLGSVSKEQYVDVVNDLDKAVELIKDAQKELDATGGDENDWTRRMSLRFDSFLTSIENKGK